MEEGEGHCGAEGECGAEGCGAERTAIAALLRPLTTDGGGGGSEGRRRQAAAECKGEREGVGGIDRQHSGEEREVMRGGG